MKYMTSIEQYWEPLYRSDPTEIIVSLPILLQAIRTVYNSSRYYNTSLRVTGFLSKVVNQLILASKKFLTNKGAISIYENEMQVLVEKIQACKMMKNSFVADYENILKVMSDAGEVPFECSTTYLFERLNSFERRLDKISEVMETCLRYKVLDRVRIAGMGAFAVRIKSAFKAISEKLYDPLAHRLTEFDTDYTIFQKEINSVEIEMKAFVKNHLKNIESVDMRLMTLKRYDKLDLECLSLGRRYLDVAVMLEREIEDIKDKYNEERGNPPIGRNVPPVVGRILWSRSLLKKIEDPLNVLKLMKCVITHPKAQLCVKYYNYLAEIFFHYEAMHHKAWFTFADQVRSRLEVPLIRKNPESNRYEVNLDVNIFQIIKETEAMWKLGLEVPETAKVLTYCKQRIISAHGNTMAIIKRNDKLRRSIHPMFVPMMRVQLIKLERVFSPALSTLTWLSLNLDEYFEEVAALLLDIECFLKEVSDINDAQIVVLLKSIEEMILVSLPPYPVEPEVLATLNKEHRMKTEKKIEIKSMAAEKAAVDLINKFVDKSGVPDYDESGKFQLPRNKITDSNWRVEEYKPIDKYDWLSFDRLHKAVGYATPEENEELCFREYAGLKYDVTLLHIDCVELFAYYNHSIIAALVKCTKRSMELLKKRSNISGQFSSVICSDLDEKPLFKASIELRIPSFVFLPSMKAIQDHFSAVLLNIIETHYAIDTWGKQAKTEERKTRKPLLDEIRSERNFFRIISEHKEVLRYKISFDNGVLQLEPKVNSILKQLEDDYKYLWDADFEVQMEKFIYDITKSDDESGIYNEPIPEGFIEKFLDPNITTDIMALDKTICVRTIQISRDKMINSLIEASKAWRQVYDKMLTKFDKIKFINENDPPEEEKPPPTKFDLCSKSGDGLAGLA